MIVKASLWVLLQLNLFLDRCMDEYDIMWRAAKTRQHARNEQRRRKQAALGQTRCPS